MENFGPSGGVHRCGAWLLKVSVLGVGLMLGAGCAGLELDRRHREQVTSWDRDTTSPEPQERPLFTAPVLDRKELVQEVLRRNPTLRAARHAWRAALERYPQVTSLEDPILGLGAAPRSFGSSNVDDAPKFDLSQKLPFPGKLALRGEVALAEADAAAHDYEAGRLHLATMASHLYDDYYLAARSLEINAQHIGLLEGFQRIATVRYEVGEAAQQDPIQAEVELTHAVHRDIVLKTSRRVTAEQINLLLHRLPDAALPAPPRRLDVPESLSEGSDTLGATALRERPELHAAEARTRARQADVDLARREFFPDFQVAGSYNRLWQEDDLQPFVGISINLPLRIDRRKAALEEAKARLERARSERAAIEDEVRFGVQSGLDRLAEAEHVFRLFGDRLVPAARDQVEAARAGFETGRNSFLALIDAERSRLDAELGLEEALTNVSRRRAELDRALGRVPGVSWGGTKP